MSRINRTQFTVLGILSLGPQSGYDIKKFIEEIIGHFWSESYGQIYPVLKQLEKDRWVQKTVEKQEGKPNRNVYSLTPKGEEELCDWLREPPQPQTIRNELLLKLFFGSCVDLEENRRHIQDYLKQQTQLMEIIEQGKSDIQQMREDYRPFWMMTARLGEQVTQARIAWCKESLETLSRMMKNTKPKKKRVPA